MRGKKAALAWLAALAALAAALVFFNAPSAAPGAESGREQTDAMESAAPPGHAVGERLPDFSLQQLDGQTFVLSGHRGQAVVLNLWATWCAPCVNELPSFDRLQRAHPGDVAVLAIHSDLITDDVAAFLAGYDYRIPFAVDEDGSVVAALGGSTMLPQTVILDRNGEVTYNQVGSMTYEQLEERVREALEGQ